MKKILFFAGLLAFVTSCTDDELTTGSSFNNELQGGISFSGVVADDLASRGHLDYDGESKFPFFWYAEQDEITVYPFGEVTLKNNISTDTTYIYTGAAEGSWAKKTSSILGYTYKATQSKNDGRFTAKNESNLLAFVDTTASNKKLAEATFAATYNATVTAVTFDKNKAIDTLTIKPNVANDVQDYSGNLNVTHYMPMYAVSQATQKEEYNSVGEKADLSFLRYGAIAGFRSNGIDATYKTLFGKLQTITLEMLGDKNDTIPASKIAFIADADAPTYKIVTASPVDFADKKSEITATRATGDSTIVATYNQAWGDGDVAYMALLPVNRAAFAKAAGAAEYYNVVYKFENITFNKDSLTTTKNWASATNGVLNMPKLNMEDYGHLVLENGQTKSLIVNSGSFDAIFKDSITIATFNTSVTAIDTLICKVDLTAAQQKRLAKFTGLKYLELTEVTSLAKGAIAATGLQIAKLPKVTSVDKEFSATALANLDSLYMASYAFNDKDVNEKLIVSSIETIDASGVTSIESSFGNEAALSFQGLTSLKKITLGTLKLTSNSFKGCTALAEVIGKVDITSAPYAFEGCTDLVKVNITGTTIPTQAFKGCTALTSVLVDGAQVAPTAIADSAFANCSALTTMNLENTTTIGAGAFKNSGLKYSSYTSATVNSTMMKVGAATINDFTFAGTGLVYVDFVNATKIGNGIFDGCVALSQIQFQKPFIVIARNSAWSGETFGKTPANVELYVTDDQSYIEAGNVIALPYGSGNGAGKTKITMGAIK